MIQPSDPGPSFSPPNGRRQPSRLTVRLVLGILRACLLLFVLVAVVLPLAMVVGGAALLGPALHSESAYRSAPECSSSAPATAPCWRMERASVRSADWQVGRHGSWTEVVGITTDDGSHTVTIFAAYPLQPSPNLSSATVQVKAYAGRITELSTDGKTYTTSDNPLTQSLVGPAVFMLAIGGLYLVTLASIRRTRLLGDGRWIWSLWRRLRWRTVSPSMG